MSANRKDTEKKYAHDDEVLGGKNVSQMYVDNVKSSKSKTQTEKDIFDKLTATNVPNSTKLSKSNRKVFTSEQDLFSESSSQQSVNSGKEIHSRILKLKHSLNNSEIGKSSGSIFFDADIRDNSSDIASVDDIFDIKDCLREHYSAIKELQNSIVQSKGVKVTPDNSMNVSERIRNIERTLRELSVGNLGTTDIAEQFNILSNSISKNKDAIEQLQMKRPNFDSGNFTTANLDQIEIAHTVNRLTKVEEEVTAIKQKVCALQDDLKSFIMTTNSKESARYKSDSLETEIIAQNGSNSIEADAKKNKGKSREFDDLDIQIKQANTSNEVKSGLGEIERMPYVEMQKDRGAEQNLLKEEIESLKSQLHKSQYDIKSLVQENSMIKKKYEMLEKTLYSLNDEVKESNNLKSNAKVTLREQQKFTENENDNSQHSNERAEHKYEKSKIELQKLQDEVKVLNSILAAKVDTAVLQELARHIATRNDLKKFIRKSQIEKFISHELRRLREDFGKQQQELERSIIKKVSTYKVNFNVPDNSNADLHTQVQIAFRNIAEDQLKSMATRLEKLEKSKPITSSMSNSETSVKDLAREFDEKLFMLCSELTNCKSLFAMQANQPFYRCAQWVWNSGKLKLGSAIPWNLETTNTDPDNFKWEQDHYNIRILDAGLYEINFAFFTKAKPSIQV
ncbi:hypothetical protein HDV06_002472 [Boothiomyces sp. JEL0866]|nr:hypothetical protein HDV06_002472 [Boothiomyces sp. JEL0866]